MPDKETLKKRLSEMEGQTSTFHLIRSLKEKEYEASVILMDTHINQMQELRNQIATLEVKDV